METKNLLLALLMGLLLTACGGKNPIGSDTADVQEPDTLSAPKDLKAIDLGLSVKWANMNVGATRPESCGCHFAWGEVAPKDTFTWETYLFHQKGTYNTLTKYNNKSDYGTVDKLLVLEPANDAAHANWGGAWRMPTSDEWGELLEKCTWTWATEHGVSGYWVTSTNGNSIFLPAGGYHTDDGLTEAGTRGYYWSSNLSTNNTRCADHVDFYSGTRAWTSNIRYYGLCVRPVQ